DPLAHQLSGGAHVVAVDLRGRCRSHAHAGPFGLRAHASDVATIAGHLGEPVILLGHAMGAFVALLAAELHPELFRGIVLVDGGTPLTLPDGDIEDALVASLGPAVARLRVTWPDRVSYQTMWPQHPAFTDGIGLDLQRTLLADLVEAPGGFRSAVSEAAVLIDGRELLLDEHVRTVLTRRNEPTTIVRAPEGMLGALPPLISDETVEAFPDHRWTTVPGTNHYTLLLGVDGASAIAAAIRNELAA
ncbi:MAG: alpha/beta fold hydrolase, partial [Ilumatobacter sp.]|uniref:alpha/beta hydrolase n=1 Tax=Ilumatobacter sp. TaxID=1967498 RepID=UPI003297239A